MMKSQIFSNRVTLDIFKQTFVAFSKQKTKKVNLKVNETMSGYKLPSLLKFCLIHLFFRKFRLCKILTKILNVELTMY